MSRTNILRAEWSKLRDETFACKLTLLLTQQGMLKEPDEMQGGIYTFPYEQVKNSMHAEFDRAQAFAQTLGLDRIEDASVTVRLDNDIVQYVELSIRNYLGFAGLKYSLPLSEAYHGYAVTTGYWLRDVNYSLSNGVQRPMSFHANEDGPAAENILTLQQK